MTKLEHHIIYHIAISNNIMLQTDIVMQCRNFAGPNEIRRAIDGLIDKQICLSSEEYIRLVKPSGYYFFRTNIRGVNVLTCTDIDGLISSLTRGRNPKRKVLLASIGTLIGYSKAGIMKNIRTHKFQVRFTQAGMRIIKENIRRSYVN